MREDFYFLLTLTVFVFSIIWFSFQVNVFFFLLYDSSFLFSRQNTISAGRTYKMKQHANNEGIRLKNWSTGEVLYDTLHSTSNVKVSFLF